MYRANKHLKMLLSRTQAEQGRTAKNSRNISIPTTYSTNSFSELCSSYLRFLWLLVRPRKSRWGESVRRKNHTHITVTVQTVNVIRTVTSSTLLTFLRSRFKTPTHCNTGRSSARDDTHMSFRKVKSFDPSLHCLNFSQLSSALRYPSHFGRLMCIFCLKR